MAKKLSDYRMPSEGTKKIAVYGTAPKRVHVKQRYWKMRKDGVKQRYWIKTERVKRVPASKRWEIKGKGTQLYKATVLAHHYIPKKDFTTISADKLLENPEKYGYIDEWLEVDVDYEK